MSKVVTMGEIMLRLSTPNNEKFIQADEFDINYGGGEANVAVSLANYGHEAEFVTAVPANPIGECAVAALRKYGVETKNIVRCGDRLGIYFLETGASMRASNVVYDRANSSIATATADKFDFDKIFDGADWFPLHWYYSSCKRCCCRSYRSCYRRLLRLRALLFLVTLISERNYGLQKRLRRL